METFIDHLSLKELKELGEKFRSETPFNHLVIDDFLNVEDAIKLADEFPKYDDKFWHSYDNPLEIKKASNDWNKFSKATYQYFTHILSDKFVNKLNMLLSDDESISLFPDIGLHGGGFHTHKSGGRLNPHLDYSIHPKLFLQRKVNIILYINPAWESKYGGSIGLWTDKDGQPKDLVKEVDCVFNRALIFDTTQNSWHGISKEINSELGLTRNSLATYYLTNPKENTEPRMKVKYAPREDQKGDDQIKCLIEKRQSIVDFQSVYRTL